jgi:hypothetical protein
MRFWDSSALVPVVADVRESATFRRVWNEDPVAIVWALTETEVLSALSRRRRAGQLGEGGFERAEGRLLHVADRWDAVEDLLVVREEAARLLRVHPLTAGDALQLAAAVVAFDHRPRRRVFLSLDEALLAAARREGFAAIRPA